MDDLAKPAGRNLSWYSIRHGVATAWAVETTIGYAHSGTENRHGSVNSKW